MDFFYLVIIRFRVPILDFVCALFFSLHCSFQCSTFSDIVYLFPVTQCVFFSFVLRNKADVSLFWEIWGHQRLPSDHKIGRKLPFGKKHHLMSFAIIQEDDGPKEEFQDEPI